MTLSPPRSVLSPGVASLCAAVLLAALAAPAPAAAPEPGDRARRFAAVAREAAAEPARVPDLWQALRAEDPVACDWILQDIGGAPTPVASLGDPAVLRAAVAKAGGTTGAGTPEALLESYFAACETRRAARFSGPMRDVPGIVFTKHYNLGGSHYAYTEGQSDAQAERHFFPGASLCLLTVDGTRTSESVLLDEPHGVIRDPDVSYDGTRVLFARKQSDRLDDYHLWELHTGTGALRQLTYGLGVADYEGIYLPDESIVFNSTRCVQIVDCWWTEVSNLYACDPDGGAVRRLSFDQVHTNFPQVLDDGGIVYTRWDYNDRGQIFPQPLFRMNADGTAQTEFYGNNSWFPTTLLHARSIPGTPKVVAIATGHHSSQTGKLCVVDPTRGRQENQGVQLIAPVRETPAERIDAYGQEGELWQYPYPLDDREFIVTYDPDGRANPHDRWQGHFGIYWMNADGERELLTRDPRVSCSQPVPLRPRPRPHLRPSSVDYTKTEGVYYVQDIHVGPGLEGVPRGTVKALRVVALDFRPAGIGCNNSSGPGGGALASTPVSISNGTWDVKTVLGTADVQADGSAMFRVPARTPVYFQALDENGYAVQTMRTWSTLQPGEVFSCVGCHESKDSAPVSGAPTLASSLGPQALQPFYGPPRGFSFPKEVQPILDRHCVGCHDDRSRNRANRVEREIPADVPADAEVLSPLGSEWRYAETGGAPGWELPEFDDSAWKTGKAGFGTPNTPPGETRTPWHTKEIRLRRTFTLPEGPDRNRPLYVSAGHDEDLDVYLNGVPVFSEEWFITEYKTTLLGRIARDALRPGTNVLAARCRQTSGGQFVDLALFAGPAGKPGTENPNRKAFSLTGDPNPDPSARRLWSDAYLELTNARIRDRNQGMWWGEPDQRVAWLNVQSIPAMLAPYTAGAAKSGLLRLLRNGHNDVELSRQELDTLACWIDLLVPYCGDYREAAAWDDGQIAFYERYLRKREILAEADRRALLPPAEDPARAVPTLAVPDGEGRVVCNGSRISGNRGTVEVRMPRAYRAGDRIRITGANHVALRADPAFPEALLFSPDGTFDIPLPVGPEGPGNGPVAAAFPPAAFRQAEARISVRIPHPGELDAYRNLAFNPTDPQGESSAYPHASSNSECRGEPVFAARNAIDGRSENSGHGGWPYQSWGPDRRNDLWWQVEFGRPVETDRVTITIRADFPHDKHWEAATLVFSDGHRQEIALRKTADPQTFPFPARTTASLRIEGLRQPEPLGWCAFTEVAVWGRDPIPVDERFARQ